MCPEIRGSLLGTDRTNKVVKVSHGESKSMTKVKASLSKFGTRLSLCSDKRTARQIESEQKAQL